MSEKGEGLMQEKTAACSWSSGKDSCLALYKAIKDGYRIERLFNFISRKYKRVSFHGATAEIVRLQSEAIGIPLIQKETTEENYEESFRSTLSELKARNINRIVRGDIHLEDLRRWVEDVCNEQGIEVILPLWKQSPEMLLQEFIGLGFKAVLASVWAEKLDSSWVGRCIDKEFLVDIKKTGCLDLCGENGEFHSFVYDGPIFSKRINLKKTGKVLIDGFWFLDIQEYGLEDKGEARQ